MTTLIRTAIAAAAFAGLGALTAGGAAAETAAAPQASATAQSAAPGTIPEKIEKGDPGTTGSTGKTLSEKLNQSEGVITPPAHIDPEMKVPAPDPHPGTMIVIPPPGAPGGNPRIQPK